MKLALLSLLLAVVFSAGAGWLSRNGATYELGGDYSESARVWQRTREKWETFSLVPAHFGGASFILAGCLYTRARNGRRR